MNTPQTLYLVSIRVRPSPDHPRYFEIGFGWLYLVLLDRTVESVRDRAQKIVEQLPFEIVGEKFKVTFQPGPMDKLAECWKASVNQVKTYGISISFEEYEIGTDEGNFGTQLEEEA